MHGGGGCEERCRVQRGYRVVGSCVVQGGGLVGAEYNAKGGACRDQCRVDLRYS